MSYLAYKPALAAPVRIQPEPNVFLEYAPIDRSYEFALSDPSNEVNRAHAENLKNLVRFFGPENAQVLEYWLDVSMFSGWKEPRRKIPVSLEVLRADLAFYASLGFRNVTTFGVWHDAEYVRAFGDDALKQFAQLVAEMRSGAY